MRDHVHVVLKIEELTLTSVDDHIRGLTQADTAKPHTTTFLQALASHLAGVKFVWIADGEGITQAASETRQPGARIAEQRFFDAEPQGDGGTYLSTVFAGPPPRIASINMHSRAKWPPEYDMQHAMSLTDARQFVSSLLKP